MGRDDMMISRRAAMRLFAGTAALASAWPYARATAQTKPDRLTESIVKEVIDGDTVVVDNGDQVRLVGLQAPRLPLDRPSVKAWPKAEAAKAALEALVLGKSVRFTYTGRPRDRYRRHLAHLSVGDVWVQGEIAKAGWARVYGFADNRARLGDLLAFERDARAGGRGIWSDAFYRVRDAADVRQLERDIDTFQLVEGKVVKAAIVRDRAYLNFGRVYRQDFTVMLNKPALDLFRAEGVDVARFEAKRVRVRGWLKSENGPAIDAGFPEQIEMLD